jgi:hypothetical protein
MIGTSYAILPHGNLYQKSKDCPAFASSLSLFRLSPTLTRIPLVGELFS